MNEVAELEAPVGAVDALALVTLSPEKYAAEVYQPFRDKLGGLIEASEAAKLSAPDVRTVAGMEVAIKQRAAFRDEVRIAGEKARVERKAPIIAIGKLLDSGYKDVAAQALPHESYWDEVIKAEEARKEAEKTAKILAERARVEAIEARIHELGQLPVRHALCTAEQLAEVISEYDGWQPDASFEELADKAKSAVGLSLMSLRDLLTTRQQLEQKAAREAEERAAEAALLEAERQALAAQKAENNRLAAEMAAERARMAEDAARQKAADDARRREAEAQAKAERDAAAAKTAQIQAELDEQRAELAEQQRAFAARQLAAEQALILEQEHGEALGMNEEFDLLRAGELAGKTAPAAADDQLEQLLDQVDAGETDIDDIPVTAGEIIGVLMAYYGWSHTETVDCLVDLDFEAAREN